MSMFHLLSDAKDQDNKIYFQVRFNHQICYYATVSFELIYENCILTGLVYNSVHYPRNDDNEFVRKFNLGRTRILWERIRIYKVKNFLEAYLDCTEDGEIG